MAETVARRGGIAVLPQDIPRRRRRAVIELRQVAPPASTKPPITLSPTNTVGDALGLIHKRAHGAVIVVDDDRAGRGVHRARRRRLRPLHPAPARDERANSTITAGAALTADDSVRAAAGRRAGRWPPSSTPTGALVGVLTRKGALRSTIYRPAVDADGRLLIAVAVGINGDPVGQGQGAAAMGVDVLVIDTAHGHQDPHARRRRGGAGSVARTRRSSPATSSRPRARAS